MRGAIARFATRARFRVMKLAPLYSTGGLQQKLHGNTRDGQSRTGNYVSRFRFAGFARRLFAANRSGKNRDCKKRSTLEVRGRARTNGGTARLVRREYAGARDAGIYSKILGRVGRGSEHLSTFPFSPLPAGIISNSGRCSLVICEEREEKTNAICR